MLSINPLKKLPILLETLHLQKELGILKPMI